jgi:thymidine phosphorylase
VGFDIFIKPNTVVAAGDVMAIIHAADETGSAIGRAVLAEAIALGDAPVSMLQLVSHRITSASVERL